MSCRDARRGLTELFRFGELNPGTAPHLDHLSACRACRDEVGLDRALVRDLRRALHERVDGHQPSATAWEAVLRRAQADEPRRWPAALRVGWAPLIGRLRAAGALGTMALAVVLAAGPQQATEIEPSAMVQARTGELERFERLAALPSVPSFGMGESRPLHVEPRTPPDPEAFMLSAYRPLVAPANGAEVGAEAETPLPAVEAPADPVRLLFGPAPLLRDALPDEVEPKPEAPEGGSQSGVTGEPS
jgi:hypothetical protein